MNYFDIVLQQIEIFIVYSCIGVLAVKCHVINRQNLNFLSKLITKIVLPLLIFTNIINGTTREDFLSSLSILLIAILMYFTFYCVGLGLANGLRLEGETKKVYRDCVLFGNCGFMGIPIAMALFSQRGAMYIAIYSVIDQLALWTVGTQILSSDHSKKKSGLETIKKMINPATVAIFLGIIILLSGIQLPESINTALTKTGAAATPLAMIYLGGMFCFIQLKDYLKKKEVYALILVKMIVLPIIMITILRHVPISSEIAVTLSVVCGLPVMTSIAMIAEAQGSDSAYASGIIFITTLFSMVTLPLICLFM